MMAFPVRVMRGVAPLAPAEAGHGAARRRFSVLIADDVEGIRRLLRIILTMTPEFVVAGEAANGKEAVRLVRELKPDIVLLDLSMPVMDGLESLPRIRYASPGSRVVVLSGFEEERLGQAARSLGAFTYIEKGAPPEEIVARLVVAADNMPPAASWHEVAGTATGPN